MELNGTKIYGLPSSWDRVSGVACPTQSLHAVLSCSSAIFAKPLTHAIRPPSWPMQARCSWVHFAGGVVDGSLRAAAALDPARPRPFRRWFA